MYSPVRYVFQLVVYLYVSSFCLFIHSFIHFHIFQCNIFTLPDESNSLGAERQFVLHGQNPGLSIPVRPAQIPAFPPQNIMGVGNASFPNEVLRASMLQTRLHGTSIFQLLNGSSVGVRNHGPQVQLRLPFANMPATSPATFSNLLSMGHASATGGLFIFHNVFKFSMFTLKHIVFHGILNSQ